MIRSRSMRARKTRAMPPLVRKKLVVVGDGECGKTCLLLVYSRDEFPEHYVPTIFENYVAELQVCRVLVLCTVTQVMVVVR